MDSSAIGVPWDRLADDRLRAVERDGFFVKNKAYILIYRAYSYWNVKMYCTEKMKFQGKFLIKLSIKTDLVKKDNKDSSFEEAGDRTGG